MTRAILLLSIRPQYANKIFDGSKTVELRRIKPKLEAEDWVLVYVSTPVQALMGMFQVDKVEESSPNRLWTRVRDRAGVTRKEFDLYYTGTDKAYGIYLKTTRQLSQPINLEYLKQVLSGFQPPQSYRYLTHDEVMLVDKEGHRFNTHHSVHLTHA